MRVKGEIVPGRGPQGPRGLKFQYGHDLADVLGVAVPGGVGPEGVAVRKDRKD